LSHQGEDEKRDARGAAGRKMNRKKLDSLTGKKSQGRPTVEKGPYNRGIAGGRLLSELRGTT